MVLKIELEKEALEILKDETEVRVDYLKDDKREMEEELATLDRRIDVLKGVLENINKALSSGEPILVKDVMPILIPESKSAEQPVTKVPEVPEQRPDPTVPTVQTEETASKHASEVGETAGTELASTPASEPVKTGKQKPTEVETEEEPEPLRFVPPKENIDRVKRKQEEEKEKKEKVGNLTLKVAIYDELKKTGEVRVKDIFEKFEGRVKINRIKRAFDTLLSKHSGLMALKEKRGDIYGLKDKEGKLRKPEEPGKEEDDDGDSTWFSPTNWAEVWDFLRNGEPGEVYTIEKVSIVKNMPGILVKSIFRDLKGNKMIEEFEPGKFRISKGMGD